MERGDDCRRNERDEHPVTAAFTALRDRLAGTAYHVLGDREDAREAVQEAFVKCWRRRDEAGEVKNLQAWIFSVVLNTARDTRRRRRVRQAESLPTEESMLPSATQPAPPQVAAGREALIRVRAAIRELPDHEREVFLLRQNGDLTFAAIAETLGAPVGTVKTRMRSALKRLRAAIDDATPRGATPLTSPARAR